MSTLYALPVAARDPSCRGSATRSVGRGLAALCALWATTGFASPLAGKDDLVTRPPLADSVQVLLFDKPLPDGRNALLVLDYNHAYPPNARGKYPKPPKKLTLRTETGKVQLSDSGLYGDSVAGDGILSGVAKVDRKRHDADVSAYLERARQKNLDVAPQFNLREHVGQVPFDLRNPLVGAGEPRQLRFTLPPFGDVVVMATPLPFLPLSLPPSTNPSQTLFITDTGVVQDTSRTYSPCQPDGTIAPFGNLNGVWSFSNLVGNMSGSMSPAVRQQFISDWLKTWVDTAPAFTVKHSDGVAVPFPIAGRPALVSAISSLQTSPWDPNSPSSLELAHLPFRLLAIVNRLDLAGQSAYGATGTAELRFVFGLVEKQGTSCGPASPQLAVILEFAVPAMDCLTMKNRANTWIALDSLLAGSPPYNAVLQTLTDVVTPINANPSKFNGSAIGQVRSNEAKLTLPWELREWRLDGPPAAQLKPVTVKNTPDPSFNFTSVINTLPILGPVPSSAVAASNLYGPIAPFLNPPWDGSPPLAVTDRFQFSSKTCSDCHKNGTATNFTMVKTDGPLNAPALLAAFLTGPISVPDEVYGPSIMHPFDEMNRRALLLDQIAANSCTHLVSIPALQDAKLFANPQILPHSSAFSPPWVH
jgi:hypothetical protein